MAEQQASESVVQDKTDIDDQEQESFL